MEISEAKQHRREIDRRSYAKNREKRVAAGRKWRADNSEKVREIKKKWRTANPDKIAKQRLRCPRKPRSLEIRRLAHRKNRYGVTSETYDTMLANQDHSCKICRKKPKTGKTLTVDHCHETGKVRGLLCVACNAAIGKLGDNEAGLLRALAYLRGV